MQLKLQSDEAELLRNILSSYLSDLKMEISNTDQYDLRESLKQQESTIKSLLGRLGQEQKKVA